ncbi:hypothetical protein I7I48_03946 [Histoplasma ohiense]|nr:hypothetical protein I7I48_03946 [Histoplasma ohiense (nom. inval.)]
MHSLGATETALTHIPKLLGHRTHQQLLRTCPSDQPPTSIRQALFVDGSIGCQMFIRLKRDSCGLGQACYSRYSKKPSQRIGPSPFERCYWQFASRRFSQDHLLVCFFPIPSQEA